MGSGGATPLWPPGKLLAGCRVIQQACEFEKLNICIVSSVRLGVLRFASLFT